MGSSMVKSKDFYFLKDRKAELQPLLAFSGVAQAFGHSRNIPFCHSPFLKIAFFKSGDLVNIPFLPAPDARAMAGTLSDGAQKWQVQSPSLPYILQKKEWHLSNQATDPKNKPQDFMFQTLQKKTDGSKAIFKKMELGPSLGLIFNYPYRFRKDAPF